MVCCMHVLLDETGPILAFSERRWRTFLDFASRWRALEGPEKDIADLYEECQSESLPNAELGYHKRCYCRFTDKIKLERAEKRVLQQPGQPKDGSVKREGHPWLPVGRLRQKSCTLGCKHETWYNYSLRNSKKNWKGTQVVSRPYDLYSGHFRSKTDIFGDFTNETLSLN